MKVKICGIMNTDSAQAAVAAGADAIGLIFHPPSSRYVETSQAADICRVVAPFVATVAVMVNPTAAEARRIIETVNPTCLQFHGEEPAEFCAAFGKPYIKALRVAEGADVGAKIREMETRYDSARGILLDTYAADRYGGTGATFDWGRIAGLRNAGLRNAGLRNAGLRNDETRTAKPIILAGGLTAENVADAIRAVRPYAVDVSSGVETGGRKDAVKIARFFRQVRAAEIEL